MAYTKKTDNPNMGRPKKDRDCHISFWITQEAKKQLDDCAANSGKSKTDLIIEALELLSQKYCK